MPRLLSRFSRRDPAFYDLLESLAGTAARAARLLDDMLARFPEAGPELFAQITACERRGDETLHAIRARLSRTSGAPIDRESVLAIASALNDIIGLAEESADLLALYGIEAPMEQSQRLAGILHAAADQVELAVRALRTSGDASATINEIHRLENEGDRVSRDAIAALFHDGIDPMVVIRWKDIYQCLERGIDAFEHVADVVDEIIVTSR